MEDLDLDPTPRRGFLGKLAAGTVALAAAGFARANAATPAPSRANPPWDDTWMTRIKGKHRQVFDAMEVNSGFPLVMANIWLMSNHDAYNIAEKDLSAVVILRHSAIPMAMTDAIWSKYKLGEAFNVTDPATGKPSERNVFATAKDFAIPPFATSAVDKNDRARDDLLRLQHGDHAFQRHDRRESGRHQGGRAAGMDCRTPARCDARAVGSVGGGTRPGARVRVLQRDLTRLRRE